MSPHYATVNCGRRLLLGTAAVLLLAGGAVAQPRTPRDYLAQMDRDSDGRISLAEYQEYLSSGFERMDRDRDGRLSAEEFPVGTRPRRMLTQEAHRRALAAVFVRQDANNDNYLDTRELAAPLR